MAGRVIESPFYGKGSNADSEIKGKLTLYHNGKFRLDVRKPGLIFSKHMVVDSIEYKAGSATKPSGCFGAPEACREVLSEIFENLVSVRSATDYRNEQLLIQCAAEKVEEYMASLPAAPVESTCKENLVKVLVGERDNSDRTSQVIDSFRQIEPRALVIATHKNINVSKDFGTTLGRGDLAILYRDERSLACATAIQKMYPGSLLRLTGMPVRWDYKKKKPLYLSYQQKLYMALEVHVYVPEP